MKLKITHIEHKPFLFQFQISKIPKENFSIKINDEVCLSCEGEIQKSVENQFLLKGNYQTSFTTSCHCCLENFLYFTKQNIQFLLLPQAIFGQQTTDNSLLNIDYFEGEDILLDHYFQTQFLIDIPFVIKCQEDCKGICSYCGINFNKESCNCSQNTTSNPFADYFHNKK